MKNMVVSSLVILASVFANTVVKAGVPLNNLEGVGGVAFNPLAYPAGSSSETSKDKQGKMSFDNFLGKPQIGTWYVNLSDSKIDWATIGIADTIFKRVELSYGYEIISTSFQDIQKHNFGAKLLVLEESFNNWGFAPAVSVGTLYKHTSFDTPAGVDNSGFDFYIVATKLIKKTLPKPVLLSGGVLSTKGRTLGVLGFDEHRDEVFFGNIDVLPLENLAVGFEYRQGAKFSSWKDANYWEAHVAWFVNKNLTLVAAYVNAGNEKSSSKVGLGDGIVLSIQYAF
ncbi:MAG: DUF3034 family protein [Sedimentisphaerales bacterium]|nr:DUF3034 family protein [Sedimentisphaerales bacterium]